MLPLIGSFIHCSSCTENFPPETAYGRELKGNFCSIQRQVGAVNFCCCECRMVSGEGDVSDVSAGMHSYYCV